MRKLLSTLIVAVVALSQSACAPVIVQQPHGPRFGMVSLQQRVLVTVQNNCVPYIDVFTGTVVYSVGLPYADHVVAPLVRQPFTNGEFTLVVRGYNEKKEFLGTDTRRYSISSYEGEKNEVWEVNYLNLPNGRGGCIK